MSSRKEQLDARFASVQKVTKDSSPDFYFAFMAKKDELSKQIDNETNMDQVKASLFELSNELQVNSAKMPKWDVGKCADALKILRGKLDALLFKTQGQFSFDEKKETTGPIVEETKSEEIVEINQVSGQKVFENLSDCILTNLITQEDVLIRNCRDVNILIPCTIGALYLTNMKNCSVSVGPVSGSIIIRDCTNCTFSISARQIRIHACLECRFEYFCTSSPVIEKSKQLLFGDYTYSYDLLAEHLTGLNFITNKKKILDFDQPTKKKSSNWDWITN